MKRKLLFVATLVAGALGFNANAQAPDLPLRADFGGSAVDLTDLNVGNGDYTLEVQGTIGTAIKVAADNLEYIPTTSATVRFAKYNGVVYVYEGGTYVTTIESEKAEFTYSDLTDTDVETGNMLQNPSFETPGELVGGTNYKLGTPWLTNVTVAASMGIRVTNSCGQNDKANGEWDLLWRGSGNNNYFSQEIEAIKPLKGYKVYIRQVASANSHAKFNVGIGNAEGDYSYVSVEHWLGTDQPQDKAHEIELVNGNTIGESYYFTVRNTATNTASSGNDPLAHIDWIGLVAANDFAVEGATSATFLNGTAYAPSSAKDGYEAVKAEAEALLIDETYKNVGGTEKATLSNLVNDEVEDNDEAYNKATIALSEAMETFKAAKTAYDAYVAAQEATTYDELPYVSAEKKSALEDLLTGEAESAEDATARIAKITPALRAYVESNAMAEGVEGVVDYTDKIANSINPANTNGWTTVGKMGTKSNEPYTNANGEPSGAYFDTDDWGNTFTISMAQDVKLPAGKYLLTVTARGATELASFTLSAADSETAIPHIGSAIGDGIFDRGWNDASVEFTLEKDGAATIKVEGVANVVHLWYSVDRFRLVRLGDADYEVEVTEAGYATYVAPVDLTFDGNAYVIKNVEDGVAALESVDAAPAGTPVIIKGEGPHTFTPAENAETVEGNLLKVAGEGGVAAADNIYVLANLDEVGFYQLDEEYILEAGKVYLETEAAGVKFIGFDFSGNATGVKTVEVATEAAENAVIYNLAGQRVANPAKGIYIVNGKKVLVK